MRCWNACERARAMYDALRASKSLPFDYAELQLLVDQSLDHISFLEAQVAKLEARIKDLYLSTRPDCDCSSRKCRALEQRSR